MSMPSARRHSGGTATNRPGAGRIANQSALLFAGFASAQAASFVRNALIGHWLSRGDFGIAALITLSLQLLEILSDLGVDRLIIQARDGYSSKLIANAHLFLILRGALIAFLLYLSAEALADFFNVGSAAWAFKFAALVPLIKGFTHLDARRMQRHLDNRATITIESAPQLIATAVCLPMLYYFDSYAAVIWLALLQACFAAGSSHLMARRPYRVAGAASMIKRLIRFGWPIWLSAFPLVAVYQGDRMAIGRLMGMEELAGYAAAFMITMVPGLIAAKVAHALMLPILSAARDERAKYDRSFQIMSEVTGLAAGVYLLGFIIAGEPLLALAFGKQYSGLGPLIACLAGMWAVRMVQVVPGMAFIASGDTRPLLYAGIIRASALLFIVPAIHAGWGLAAIALIGVGGELASLTFLAWRIALLEKERAAIFIANSLWIFPMALIGVMINSAIPAELAIAGRFALGAGAILICGIAILKASPGLRQNVLANIRITTPRASPH